MGSSELVLQFAGPDKVNVSFEGTDSGQIDFASPITEKDRADIQWYVETYGARSLADADDGEAQRIEQRLPEIGKALFDGAISKSPPAFELFLAFRNSPAEQRVLTVKAEDAAILSLPWELLHDTSAPGAFLFREKPHISIRRTISGATTRPFRVDTKDRLHLLFVVSRPTDAGFIDPRADPQAVLDALQQHAPGCVTCEFLWPATLEALAERLDDETQPAIDILHFDGHGVFAKVSEEDAEKDPDKFGKSILSEIQKERRSRESRGEQTAGKPVGIGFLLFEKADRSGRLISAEDLANELYRARVGLVVLSACQTASLDDEGDPMASVAGRLTGTGIPAILAMTHSVLVTTTRMLFGKFYASLAKGRGIATSLDDARAHLARQPEKHQVLRDGRPEMLKLQDWFLPALFHSGADAPLLSRVTDRAQFDNSSLHPPSERGSGPPLHPPSERGSGPPLHPPSERGSGPPLHPPSGRVGRGSGRGGESEDRHEIDAETGEPLPARSSRPSRREGEVEDRREDEVEKTDNLRPRHEAGFFGRRRELWDIGYWFGTGQTRRISITGFGGQGKTELALEAGRWLLRTGMFRQVVFIDYANVQSHDAVSLAVSTIATVAHETLSSADEAAELLARVPTLVILDNLESVAEEALQELLTAASGWSVAGESRVLLTTRVPDTGHPDYAIEGTFKHRRIVLEGLGSIVNPDDALDWFCQLDLLPSAEPRQVPPPERDELIRLFDRVRFHPLSICVLVQQLRTRTADWLDARLETLLAEDAVSPVAQEGTPRSLIASLELSLERLGAAERDAAGRLGVFQGGAFEVDLLEITELGASDQQRDELQSLLTALESGDPRVMFQAMGMDLPDDAEIPAELLAQLTDNPELQQHIEQLRAQLSQMPASGAENLWPGLRRSLQAAALIEAESVPGVGPPFLRFHPTLAPMLWAGLEPDQRDALTLAHRQRYYALAKYLYHEDDKNPHQARAIARRELPNLLHAVNAALDAGDADAVEFVASVNWFLTFFGMTREAALLTRRAEQAGGERGSRPWYLAQSNRGEQMLASGHVGEAAEIFTDILKTLGDVPSFGLAVTLARMGRCYRSGGRPDLAEATYRQGIAVTDELEPSDQVKRHRGALQTELATVLRHQGKYAEARVQYELALEPVKELNDLRSQGVILGQLGALALQEGNIADAVKRYQEALELFQRLGEPGSEAVVQHQLGMAFRRAGQWEQAEQHYREAARLHEQGGNLAMAAQTWGNLAIVNESAGKPEAAETWYCKAIEGGRKTGDTVNVSKVLNNLANLLQTQPGRVAEAQELAEEALAIMKILDPGAAEIWTTYNILAKIAGQQAEPDRAAEYRRLAREAKRNFAGTAHEMKRYAQIILTVVAAVGGNADAQAAAGQLLDHWKQLGGENAQTADAIECILAGERDEIRLLQNAGPTSSMIIETILQAIEDPSTLAALLPPEGEAE